MIFSSEKRTYTSETSWICLAVWDSLDTSLSVSCVWLLSASLKAFPLLWVGRTFLNSRTLWPRVCRWWRKAQSLLTSADCIFEGSRMCTPLGMYCTCIKALGLSDICSHGTAAFLLLLFLPTKYNIFSIYEIMNYEKLTVCNSKTWSQDLLELSQGKCQL